MNPKPDPTVIKAVVLLSLFAISFSVSAQKAPIKFGDIPMEDLQMKTCPADTSAAALVLADYGNSTINYSQTSGFTIGFERIRRVKIFKKAGFDFATLEIRLYHKNEDEEKLGGLKAVSYSLVNGKMVSTKMKSEQVFKQKEDENINSVKFTLPNVTEGCIVEMAYTINSDFLYNFQDWQFQETIPVRWSEYRANIPEYFVYNKFTKGYLVLDVNESKNTSNTITLTSHVQQASGDRFAATNRSIETEQVTYEMTNFRWAVANAPAFKEEPFMNNYLDYISQINFELSVTKFPNQPIHPYTQTWETFNEQFLTSGNFGGMIKGSGFLSKIAEDQTSGIADPKEKAARLYDYVKSNVQWNGELRKYPGQSFRKTLDDHKGNSSDINLLLVSLLQKAGLDASPVLISTRNHGFVRVESPLSSQFNYALCTVKIGESDVLLDATDPSLPSGILPKRCLNGQGFIISQAAPGWIPVITAIKSKSTIYADLVFKEDGNLEGKVTYRHSGYNAQTIRKAFAAKGEENYVKSLATENKWEIQKSQFDNLGKISEPVVEAYTLSIAEHVQSSGSGFFFTPLFDSRIDANPFKSETREYPVDFGNASEESFTVKVKIPESFVIDELPKSKIISLPDNGGKFVYNVASLGNTVTITSGLSINKSLFSQAEYPALREFYAQVVAKQEEQVFFKKK